MQIWQKERTEKRTYIAFHLYAAAVYNADESEGTGRLGAYSTVMMMRR